jgi:endonuclease/exonuclease/phosphatase family metal-dependent hydrolase
MATNFPERARALALEISEAEPDLVGLQEVSLYRTGEPGVLDGPATPATTVIQDFLTILQQELQSAGLQYSPAIVLEESDVETPSTLGYDIRLTQRDVILARDGVVTSNAQGAHFTVNLEVPTVAGPLTVFRGWASVDATVHQRTVRFVTTHLEAFSPVHRFFQALELALPGGPAFTTLPVVLVGDLNSGPHEEDPLSAYGLLTSAGFSDTWTAVHPDDPGFTCCYAENLRDPEPVLSERIDHVLARLGIEALRAKLVGVDPDARTPSGLWPSDHAGIVTTLTP